MRRLCLDWRLLCNLKSVHLSVWRHFHSLGILRGESWGSKRGVTPVQARHQMKAAFLATPSWEIRINLLLIFLRLNLSTNCFTITPFLFKKKESLDTLAISRILLHTVGRALSRRRQNMEKRYNKVFKLSAATGNWMILISLNAQVAAGSLLHRTSNNVNWRIGSTIKSKKKRVA